MCRRFSYAYVHVVATYSVKTSSEFGRLVDKVDAMVDDYVIDYDKSRLFCCAVVQLLPIDDEAMLTTSRWADNSRSLGLYVLIFWRGTQY